MTNKLPAATTFDLALFHFRARPLDERGRLMRAIDDWRAAEWKGRTALDKQIVTACERALACAPIDLPKAMAGIQELVEARSSERSFERMAEEAAALERERTEKSHEGEAAPAPPAATQAADPDAPPALPLDPRQTRWDDRRDLQ